MAAEETAQAYQENSIESSNDSDEDSSRYCPEYNTLRDMTADICSVLPIKSLIPLLISAHVIDFPDRDELCEGDKSDRKVTEFFISKHLSRSLMLGNTKKFKKFMAVIRHSGKCDELVDRITERIKHYPRRASGINLQFIIRRTSVILIRDYESLRFLALKCPKPNQLFTL